jgi:hypothetical protein
MNDDPSNDDILGDPEGKGLVSRTVGMAMFLGRLLENPAVGIWTAPA